MKKRILCLTLGLMLTISQAVPAGAASRKDQLKQDKAAAQSQLAAQESKINNLEDQKQTLSAEIDQLDSDLVNIMVEIEILDGELSDKEAQIEQTKADLAVAEENKQKQYEAMKKRIQYLYEKGGDDAWAQMLFQASDFTSLLNQAEYVQQMYDSDRNSLEEFKETVQQVKDLGDQLDSEKAELEEMNQEYQNRQASMQTQLEEKKATSSDYDAQIAQAQNQAAQYTELIRQQNAEIQKIEEEEKKAAEEAARKAAEEAAKKAAAEAVLSKIKEGDTIEGTVKNVTDFGAFIDLGGVDGLLHISEMSWGRTENPKKVYKIGDSVKCFIKEINGDKIALSVKYPDLNPWNNAAEKYAVGNVVKGTVARMTDFGAFVQLEDGIDALLHVSQISRERIEKPSDALSIGQEIEAKVVDLNEADKKISLSIKALLNDNEAQEEAPATEE